MNKSKAKLLYITSMGHSGSTLLDLLCGSVPGIFSKGGGAILNLAVSSGDQAGRYEAAYSQSEY
jgi:hypothetical protein